MKDWSRAEVIATFEKFVQAAHPILDAEVSRWHGDDSGHLDTLEDAEFWRLMAIYCWAGLVHPEDAKPIVFYDHFKTIWDNTEPAADDVEAPDDNINPEPEEYEP